MYIKITNGNPQIYSLSDLQKDNPQVSFPSSMSNEVLAEFDVYPLKHTSEPNIDTKTHRHLKTIQMVDGEWSVVWQVIELPEEQASENVRAARNGLLRDTDWMGLSDNTMTTEWVAYRQSLRDLTDQEGFPFNVQWPVAPN